MNKRPCQGGAPVKLIGTILMPSDGWPPYLPPTVASGSWQMLPAESRSPWRRRFSRSSRWPCPAQCLEGTCPLHLVTAAAAWLPRWPHPSPRPPPSAAAPLQVSQVARVIGIRGWAPRGCAVWYAGDRWWFRHVSSFTLYWPWSLKFVDWFVFLLLMNYL